MILAACGGSPPGVVASASFVVTEQSGTGPSPLDGLVGQTVAFEIDFSGADPYPETVDVCRWNVLAATQPPRTASGATASTVQTEILDILPAWDLRLALCDPASSSSVGLHADNEAGLGVIFGCLSLPASAMVKDADGNPVWTEFTAATCDATIYDQLHGRVLGSRDFTMKFTR